jgi:hypothetical protein
MSCTRCGGTVVMEGFSDEKSSNVEFQGARCLNCGHIDDPVIRANRVQPALQRSRPAGMVGVGRGFSIWAAGRPRL